MSAEQYMRQAVALARKGEGRVNPNPLVGAVIVRDGRVIGEGYHRQYGSLHAEREALADCAARGESPAGAEIYVTLEPCCHFGKQPPCTSALVEARIKKVVIGSRDPNPLVSGKGAEYLREHGVLVEEDFLREECDSLNDIFFHYITTGLPYVAIKYAMTADGRTATVTGKSRWITGEEARRHVHTLRNRYAAILAGINTVLMDDPMLNCRIDGGRDPLRIICDSHLRIPMDSAVVKSSGKIPTAIVCSNDIPEKRKQLEAMGIEVLCLPGDDGMVDLKALVQSLGRRGIDSLFIEGGSRINYSAMKAGIVNHVYCYVAPKIFGGLKAQVPVSGDGVDSPDDAFRLEMCGMNRYGQDILLEYKVR